MGIEVFNRYEKKFLLNQEIYNLITEKLNENMELDAFNKKNGFYTICNIYYDTSSNELIKKSLSKPVYKEKLRLRSYGVPDVDCKAYLEIKKKYNGMVNKRRTKMTIEDAYKFVATGEIPKEKSYHNRQVMKEIDFFLKRYELEPSVYIAYDRTALFDNDLRITFDHNIRTRRYDLALELGDYGEALLDEDQWLMEIKVGTSYPLWLTKILSDLNIYSNSFSKYGREYLKQIDSIKNIKTNLKGDHEKCLNHYLAPQLVPQYL
ncbi:MAG: polyphosphate polymerase domain-containing protein [Clostridiaceae bacterium]